MLFCKQIIYEYYGCRTAAAEVSVSRSVWSLIDNGYATGISPIRVQDLAMVYGMQGKSLEEFKERYGDRNPNEKLAGPAAKGFNKAKAVALTEKGRARAGELLNVK